MNDVDETDVEMIESPAVAWEWIVVDRTSRFHGGSARRDTRPVRAAAGSGPCPAWPSPPVVSFWRTMAWVVLSIYATLAAVLVAAFSAHPAPFRGAGQVVCATLLLVYARTVFFGVEPFWWVAAGLGVHFPIAVAWFCVPKLRARDG